MADSERVVHIVDEVSELDGVEELTMVMALTGFLDAGQSADLAAAHLEQLSDGPVVATFDVDQLHDYRARRPPLTFAVDHYTGYEAPRLVVRLRHDSGGTPFLLMRGPEPDIRWEAFCRGVREIVERLGVTRVVGLGAVPMAIPHTRPIAITHHANTPDLVAETSPWTGELRVPASVQALLEIRLGEWGHDSLGYVAHVPHYLAQMEFSPAAVALLEQVERGGRLIVDQTSLREASVRTELEIERLLESNSEIKDVVQALEQQYDSFQRAAESGDSLLAQDQKIPTGEELGREFERFLAGLDEESGTD